MKLNKKTFKKNLSKIKGGADPAKKSDQELFCMLKNFANDIIEGTDTVAEAVAGINESSNEKYKKYQDLTKINSKTNFTEFIKYLILNQLTSEEYLEMKNTDEGGEGSGTSTPGSGPASVQESVTSTPGSGQGSGQGSEPVSEPGSGEGSETDDSEKYELKKQYVSLAEDCGVNDKTITKKKLQDTISDTRKIFS